MSALEIDAKFVDYDFPSDEEFVAGDLGYSEFETYSAFGDSFPVLSDSEINEAIEKLDAADGCNEHLVTRVFNQGREGSCVGNATTQSQQVIQALQGGKESVIQLSPISLYSRIGRSARSGAMVSDGLKELSARGVLPLDTPENRAKFGEHVMEHTGYRSERKFPSGWEETAAKFRGVESHVVRKSVNELMTALCLGYPVVVGREGHSICYLRPVVYKRNWGALYVNSWGNWGQAAGDFAFGFGIDTMNQVKKSANWAFVIRGVTTPSEK